MKITKEEYREAYLIWKKENPEKENIPRSTIVMLPNEKKVSLGRRIDTMKMIYKEMQKGEHYGKNQDLTEDEIAWWTEHGVDLGEIKKETYTEEEYREAYLIWKKENPKTTSVPQSTIVPLPNGRKIPLGQRISTMQMVYKFMQEGKNYQGNRDLTEDEIAWWAEHGLDLGKRQKVSYTEDEYREAFLKWKKENPKKRNVPRNTVVILQNGKKVPLGNRIRTMQMVYKFMQEGKKYQGNKDLTEDQISWWTEQGIELRGNSIKNEEDYREAYLIWKEENPEKEDVPCSVVIELPNGKKVSLGQRINTMKFIYNAMQKGKQYEIHMCLTEEKIAWWTEHGVNLEKSLRQTFSEEECQEAYLIWKKENPKKEDVPCSAVIELPNGKKVSLGQRIALMKYTYQATQKGKQYGKNKDLTEEQIAWWTEHGVNLGKKIVCSEEEYREAYLIWKRQNPKKQTISQLEVIELPNGKKIPLGRRIAVMKLIYHAMEEGKHHQKYRDLTKEQIAWWTEHGLSFEKLRTRLIVKNILTEFNIDLDELIRSLENVKEKDGRVELSENKKEQTLRRLCIEGGYNYDITMKAIKLHAFFQNDTLEQLIGRIIISNPNKNGIASWIYDIYGDFIIQILLELNLDASQILKETSRNIIPLEEAICNQIFSNMCKKQKQNFLKSFYKTVIKKINFQETEDENAEMIVQEIMKIRERNGLTESENETLKNGLFEYLRVIRKYQVMDVGLEEDSDKKQKKIQEYNLREEEKESAKENRHSTEEEFFVMDGIRRKIDKMPEGIQKKKKQ